MYKLKHRVKALEVQCEYNYSHDVKRPPNTSNESNRYIEKDDVERTSKRIENDQRKVDDLNNEYRTKHRDEPHMSQIMPGFDKLKKHAYGIRQRRKSFQLSLNTFILIYLISLLL